MKNVKYLIRRALKKILYGLSLRLFPEISNNEDRYKIKDIITVALERSNDPVFLINFYYEKLLVNDKILWGAIKDLRIKAPLNYKSIVNDYSLVKSKSLYLSLMATYVINDKSGGGGDKIELLVDGFNALKSEVNGIDRIKGLIASAIVINSNIFEINSRLEIVKYDIKKLTDHQKVKLMGRYLTNGDEAAFLSKRNALGNIDQAANIKIDQMYFTLKKDDSKNLKVLEEKFESLPFEVSERYTLYVKPLFDNITDENNFTDASYSIDKILTIQEKILDSITSCESLSFIRLGDGESYGFRNPEYIDIDGYIRQEIHWWGETLPEKIRGKLQCSFVNSLKLCDFLGVPTVTRLIKDFNLEKKDSYEVNTLISRIFCVMTSSEVFFERKIIVEDQVNLHIFGQKFLDDIFETASKVVVVSGVDKGAINQWAPDETKLECIEVPTHRILREQSIASTVEGILPYVYEDYLNVIRKLAGPGVVFIVSAGFIGKIFIAEAAKHGSVALDIGQTLVSLVNEKRVSE